MRDTIHPLLRRFSILLLLACVTVSGTATATDYTVELVVYANLQRDSGAEQWPVPRTLPDTEHALTLGTNGTRPLEGPRKLQAIADTLRRSGNYRVLLHAYWQQPGWAPRQRQPIQVQIPSGSA
ncbi:MAG: hypothetical protein HZB57_04555, partial [Gammaproteobacteria bacterium]|nr:hypothetical protein [Gammaproteobacteria bacterium]